MVMTNSTMLPLGTSAPDFALPDCSLNPGDTVRLSDYAGKPLLVVFMCNHCPFVKHLADALADFAQEYQGKGLETVAISSNDVATHPSDSPQAMQTEAGQRGYTFAYLYDATQEVAKAYHAACTPDFFLFDGDHKLVYRGQFDNTRPTRNGPGDYTSDPAPDGADMRRAADAVLAGGPVPEPHIPSVGCNIKWIAGNEPAYFGPQ